MQHPLVLDLVRALWRRDLGPLSNWSETDKSKTVEVLSQQHGLSGWVLKSLKGLDPDEVWFDRTELRDFETLRRKRHMQDYRQVIKFVEALRDKGICVGGLKGTALSQVLFDDPMLRSSNDFDLLIDPKDLLEAISIAVICDANVDDRLIHADEAALQRLSKWRKDIGFSIGESLVELHTRPFFLRSLSEQVACKKHGDKIELSTTDQFFYSACHGQMTSWVRLKWALDAALLGQKLNDADWQLLREKTRAAGCEASFLRGLSWLDHLWDTEFCKSFGGQPKLKFEKNLKRLKASEPRLSPLDAICFTQGFGDRWRSFVAFFLNPELTTLEGGNAFTRTFRYVGFVLSQLSQRGIRFLKSRRVG